MEPATSNVLEIPVKTPADVDFVMSILEARARDTFPPSEIHGRIRQLQDYREGNLKEYSLILHVTSRPGQQMPNDSTIKSLASGVWSFAQALKEAGEFIGIVASTVGVIFLLDKDEVFPLGFSIPLIMALIGMSAAWYILTHSEAPAKGGGVHSQGVQGDGESPASGGGQSHRPRTERSEFTRKSAPL